MSYTVSQPLHSEQKIRLLNSIPMYSAVLEEFILFNPSSNDLFVRSGKEWHYFAHFRTFIDDILIVSNETGDVKIDLLKCH